MILSLKELIVLKEKLKNTYAYQNSPSLKAKEKGRMVEETEDDLVYKLVKHLEKNINLHTMIGSKLNDKVVVNIEKYTNTETSEKHSENYIEMPSI